MRVNDKSIRELLGKVGDTHTRVKVIETKVIAMEKHLETQNGRLNKHADAIQKMQIGQEGLKVKLWAVSLLCGGSGGVAGYVLGSFVSKAIGV